MLVISDIIFLINDKQYLIISIFIILWILLFQANVTGLTGDILFDFEGFRKHFALDIIELSTEGIKNVSDTTVFF